ncbi:hypothetical protein JCM6882_007673 [Rhodosporidiobolus microsporus]
MAPPAKKQKTAPAKAAPAPSKAAPTGDDLEDNFALEDDFLAPGSPAADGAELSEEGGDEDGAVYDNVDEDSRPPQQQQPEAAKKGKKRSAEGDEEGEEGEDAGAGKGKKKAKKAKEKKAAKVKEANEAQDGQDADETALLPLEAVADRLAEKQKRALPDLSALEMDEMRISQSMIFDTSSVTNRKTLLDFMKEALPTPCNTLAKMPKATGSPRIIVVAGAALRVADLCRDVKSFRTKTKDGLIDVGKLFAKHFKLSEHVEYLNKTHVGVAVGTPNRIEKLLNETEALHLTHLSHLILDVSHLDAKKRSLVDLIEARGDLFRLLGSKKIMERLREGKMKLVIF